MIRSPFNAGWTFRPKANEFAELTGAAMPPVPVTLPHDAIIGTPRDPDAEGGAATGYFHGGTWEYSKSFDAPQEWAGKRIYLEFEGIYRSSLVYVNGALARSWASGYTGFTVPLNDFLVLGEENTLRVEARAHRDSRWYSGGGIHRPVHLMVAGTVHVPLDGVTVTTEEISQGFATITVRTEITNAADRLATVQAETLITAPDGTLVVRDSAPVTLGRGETTVSTRRLVVENPALWSLDDPALHQVQVLLRLNQEIVDETQVRFGIRQFAVDPIRGLRLNGREVKLRGACVHHDNGLLGAATIGRAEERRVELLKDAGFNAIRSSHNPLSRAMLDACDKHGMLVMDEAFDAWTQSKNDFDYVLDFEASWERDIEAMVRKDRNHASVFAYSTGNEIPEVATPHGARWARKLANRVRELDPTRFVTHALNGQLAVMKEFIAEMMADPQGNPEVHEGMGINTMMSQMAELGNHIGASELATNRTEEAFSTVDIAGMNYTEARYELDRELFPHRVIVGAETFATHIDKLWALVTDNTHVIGDFTWTGWDYLGEVGIGRTRYTDTDDDGVTARYPWLLAHVGDIDITGHRRPASFYREIVFGLRPTPYIAVGRPENHDREIASSPWAWSDSIASWTWPTFEGKPITVEVYSDADEVELLLNDTPIGRAPAGAGHRYRAVFETTYHPGTLTAVSYSDGDEVARHQLATAQGRTRVKATADRTQISAADTDLAFIDIALVDDDGSLFSSADQPLTVSVSGPGTLQAFGTANPTNEHTHFTDETHRTYDGRALAIIRPTAAGSITINVSAADGTATEVTVGAGMTTDNNLARRAHR
ncbi:glycoside hydrolase family 2 TIM barrel-domain containing protein [Arthrobacter sp. HS15c]|uniref:glycoside hydrolase family 2 TIM barrel-domain containing protein n=1 Tax=Arthrobacter sp. HS15c TaxID=3230279 RepID=UPI0034657DE2